MSNNIELMEVIGGGIEEINNRVDKMNAMVTNFNKGMKWCARFRKNGISVNPSDEFVADLQNVIDDIRYFAEATEDLIDKYISGEINASDIIGTIMDSEDIESTIGDSGPIEVEEEEETKPSISDAPNNPFKDEYVESDVNTSGGTNP